MSSMVVNVAFKEATMSTMVVNVASKEATMSSQVILGDATFEGAQIGRKAIFVNVDFKEAKNSRSCLLVLSKRCQGHRQLLHAFIDVNCLMTTV